MSKLSLEEIKTVAFEPKMKNRFIVNFKKGPFQIRPEFISKCTKPKFHSDWGWEEIFLEIYDTVHSSSSKDLMKGIRKLGSTGLTNKLEENEPIVFEIMIVDAVGNKLEEWLIEGKLKYINFGELNWADTEPCVITLIIDPIKVELLH